MSLATPIQPLTRPRLGVPPPPRPYHHGVISHHNNNSKVSDNPSLIIKLNTSKCDALRCKQTDINMRSSQCEDGET